ncbi:MAG: PrsW family intramembrane metalloprotease [Propionibacteriaceae bacterium]|jgi:RsiW-degrading membrane proteinase PrsW (M82 family)|nr:PrsW family intramembrane metalloprotease [Propionibacteriaceae bacterium]
MSAAPAAAPRVVAYERRRAGVPAAETGRSWQRRLAGSRWTWTTAALLAAYVAIAWWLYGELTAARPAADGAVIPGLNADALWASAKAAAPTLAVFTVLFLAADRYRPQRALMWGLALGWGGLAAVALSYVLNNWAGSQLAVYDMAPGLASARIAIFIAPFVEEAAKATVLFLIAFLDRGRLTSRVSGVVLAGLSAVGFAFTENILYFARILVYGSYTYGADVQAAFDQTVFMRGVVTCFGHPLFTIMTGIGLVIGVRHRSKTVRVAAPLAGYLGAALLHMLFNTAASLVSDGTALAFAYFGLALPLVFVMVFKTIRYALSQSALIRERLTDYVLMGWLPATYPLLFCRARTRAWALCMSPWHGNLLATVRLQRAVTELAYLRDAVTAGTVDHGGAWREHELIGRIRALRSQGAIENPRGLRPYFWRRIAEKIGYRGVVPGAGGQKARHGKSPRSGQVSSGGPVSRTAVDPRWGPPA